ncbi:efflux RND transporter permease subunit [Brevibacillus fulvus]|uniref:HAE1 family hydrophobic/amphiphilic exporter-1 n=1 Tax=Brevibacillus fulvus TaxID=1125967 RepID=A0A939BUQ1_9BACL|nr:efflux RND transporter permease subunit [Brevibacillus fulvus]MBM7590674.1 HAE1 family hydrophobic/amphiphilic exporter-1 [Brevibacillus fulvus]
MHISQHSIRRPVTVMMGVLIVVLLGIISLTRIPIDLYPDIEIPTVAVITSYSGVGPEEIENLVTKPVEDAVATVSGVKSITSNSREGSSQVIVEFDYGADLDEAISDIQQKVERARRSLPDDADAPSVVRFDPNSTPVLTLAISSDMKADQLKRFVDDQIVPYLERVDGVASVDVSGGVDREIKIIVNDKKLEQYGLTVSDLNTQLRNQNLDGSGGKVTEGGISYQVRSIGKFASIDDIRKVSIPLQGGGHIFLEDIAVVQDGYKDISVETKLDGKNTVTVTIMKQSGSNTVAVVDNINEQLQNIQETMSGNFSFVSISDQSKFIRASINTLEHDTLIGGLLAIIIILVFLRSLSNTLIIATAIPIAVISTFALMFFSGMSINTMSLGGLTLGIGMIVDDAIVVLENIHRHRERGASIVQAAVEGTKEVSMPVIAATLTTIAVFLPIVFVEGVTAQLFKDLGVTVSFSLIVSLVVSLTVTPMLATKWTAAAKANTHFEKSDGKLVSAYRKLLRWALGHRKTVVAIGLASLAAGVALIPFLGSEFMPSSDQGQVNVSIQLPTGTELEKTREVMNQALATIEKVPEVKSILSALGTSNATRGSNNASEENASFFLQLSDLSERSRSTAEIVDDLRKKLNRFPGARVRISEVSGGSLPFMGGGGGGAGGSGPIAYAIRGGDSEKLKELAELLTDQISTVEGVREADNSLEQSTPQVQVRMDKVRAAELGVTQSMISSTVSTALNDQVATTYETDGTEIDVSIVPEDGDNTHIEDIGNLLITTSNGEKVQLKDVAEVVMGEGPRSISRYNQARTVTIMAQTAPNVDLGTVSAAVDEVVRSYPLPAGYAIEKQGTTQQMDESTKSMLYAFGLAIVLVYIILAAQFESMVYPLSIMLSVPLSIFGASFSLWITNRPLSIPAFIGLILLVGIVVRNAIVLIDFTNILRGRGTDRTEALLIAGPTRLRPIVMTTLTTSLGLLPLAMGLGEGSESQSPMATVVIGGLLLSTLLTLVVIPVVYSILDDMSISMKKTFRKWLPARNKAIPQAADKQA